MIALLFFSMIMFLAFNAKIVGTYGVPTSLSRSYYLLDKKGWIFSVMLTITAMSLMVVLLSVTTGRWYQFIAFIAATSTIFVAFSPRYIEVYHSKIHLIAATAGAVAAVMLSLLLGYWYVIVGAVVLFGAIAIKRGNIIYWAEMACFAVVYISGFFAIYGV